MKILIITSGFFPITDGQGGAVEKLLEYYLDYNEKELNEIDVYTVKLSSSKYDKKKYKYTKFKIIDKTKMSFKIKRLLYGVLNKISRKYVPNAYIREVVKNLKRENKINYYDRIIFENGQNFIPYFKAKTKTKSKIILHLHNDYLNKDTKNGKEIINNCNEIWAISNFIKNQVKEINSKKIRIEVLYNGIDTKNFTKELSENEQNILKNKLNIKNEFVFLYTGRLMTEKGIKELIIAFNKINNKYNNLKLLIVGGTKNLTEKDKYKLEISKLASDNKNIIFIGKVDNSEIYKYYKISNVQVVPSLCNEAFGLILLEGMASNLPIIATNSGAIPEVLGENDFYVSKNNIIEELAEKMEEVLDYRLDEKEKNKYKLIISKFSLENYCNNFSNLLK